MRVGVLPDHVLERLALAGGLVPTPLVPASFGTMAFRTLVAAVRLGVFEVPERAGAPQSAAEVAGAAGLSEAGTRTLLHALSGLRSVRHHAGRPRNGRLARRWLLAGARGSLRDAVLFLGDLGEQVGSLEEAIRSGAPRRLPRPGCSPAAARAEVDAGRPGDWPGQPPRAAPGPAPRRRAVGPLPRPDPAAAEALRHPRAQGGGRRDGAPPARRG